MRLIKLLSLVMALVTSFLVCDTTVVMAQQYSTGTNHTMAQNATMTPVMVENSTNSSMIMSHKTNETLGVKESVSITKNKTAIATPLTQLKNGVSINDIKCIEGMQLILKKEDGSPACVKPDDATKLTERGWGQAP